MYLAMNRFTVPLETAEPFEQMWLSRESTLHEMEGFVSFHMLKGPEKDGTRLYASHTIWESEAHFKAWTTSQQFRDAHAKAGAAHKKGEGKPGGKMFMGAPQFEGFTSIQTIEA